ncbi:hypothetical protein RJ55_08147 [Drechmeria coniospora]|nr:hypothetical protein RJ55_08147 [Drechmeria coniospora]
MRSTPALPPSRTQGPVMFPAFQAIDEEAAREVARYRILSFGQIHQFCEHIPYNSSKKDFYEKTGRESIEAFQYEFRVPGQAVAYKVMWDYNIGLVRMNPFFKCLGYAKTKPSQMLDKNPGLRDISPSITGGSVSAQGYWIPYRCARAICATFCFDIAGAMIPLFGPAFPSECIPPHCKEFGEMVISQQLIADEAFDAAVSRSAYLMRKEAAQNRAPTSGLHGSHRPAHDDGAYRNPRSRRFHPPWAPMGVAGAYQPAVQAACAVGGADDMEMPCPCHNHEGPNLPCIQFPAGEHQTQRQMPRPLHESAPQMVDSSFFGMTGDPWTTQRQWTDGKRHSQHAANAPIDPRLQAAKMDQGRIRYDNGNGKDETTRPSQPPSQGADYAAAEVLMALQRDEQELQDGTAGPAPEHSLWPAKV